MTTKNPNKSLLRALSVIKFFNSNDLELGSTDIAKKMGMPVPTAHRILSTFAEAGLLDKNAKTGKYSVGPTLFALGRLYLSHATLLRAAEPVVKLLNDLTGEAIHVSILDRQNAIVVMKEETKGPFRFVVHIGTVVPAYASAMGKASLSELTEAEIDNLFPEERLKPLAKKTIATKTELKRHLEQVRRNGIAFNIDESAEGVVGIGSVLRGVDGRAMGAMAIAIPPFKLKQARVEQLVALLKLGCNLVSYRLGYQDMTNPVRNIEEICFWWERASKKC